VGEQLEVAVDVRVLSATHKNLSQLVAEGKFREDLFYRVNVIELRVPSLRERPEDVPELAEAILRRLGRRMKLTPPMLGKDALSAFETYAFPGNVRELENILERAITLTTSGEIRAIDIQLRPTPGVSAGVAVPTKEGALGDHLEDIERDAIIKALEQTRYNKTAAAKILGMSFRALRYRVKKLGIE
jgi:two-component system response regulator PilR (NtrC family)